MSVWIVHELAEIHDLIEEAESRSIKLSMLLIGSAEDLKRQATTTAAKVAVREDVRIKNMVGSSAATLHRDAGELRKQAAISVKLAARLIHERER